MFPKRFVYMGLIALLPACVSTPLHTRVFKNVHVGDSSEHVMAVLGAPDSFKYQPGTNTWIYSQSGSVCGIEMDDQKVKNIACDSSGYISPAQRGAATVGGVMKGMSEGLKNSRQPSQTNCRPDYAGGYQCTTY